MPRYVKTDKSIGQIVSLLKPKRRPSGRKPANAFQLGFDPRRNPGGIKFTKWRQRLSQLSADMLGQVASDAECEFFGMAAGSTNGEVLVHCLLMFATHGDVGAARLLFEMSEKAKLRPESATTLEVFAKARAELREAMGNELQPTAEPAL
jgi:hypothetical protein